MIPRARLEEVCKNFPQNCSSKQEIAEEGVRPGMNKPCQDWVLGMEPSGLEPLTPCMPCRCSTS
jgi:hypothetical protein